MSWHCLTPWKRRGGLWLEVYPFFQPRDLWIGVYWKTWPQAIALYVCPLPTVGLYVYIQRYR